MPHFNLTYCFKLIPKDPPENIQLAMELWRRDAVYSRNSVSFRPGLVRTVGVTLFLQTLIEMKISSRASATDHLRENKAEGGVTEADLINNINLNRYFFDNDIKPLRSANEMTGVNFIYQAFSVLMPYLAAAVVLLLCGDCFTSRWTRAALSFSCCNLSRSKVFSAKILSCLIITFTVISSSTLAVFLIMSAFNGKEYRLSPFLRSICFSSIPVTPQVRFWSI